MIGVIFLLRYNHSHIHPSLILFQEYLSKNYFVFIYHCLVFMDHCEPKLNNKKNKIKIIKKNAYLVYF